MGVYFFDSSALVKRYATEVGAKWVRPLTDPASGNEIYIARIAGAEIIAAISGKTRNKGLSASDATRAIGDFRYDFDRQYNLLEVTESVIDRAMDLAEQYPLRGYDAVQLASAIELNTQFVAVNLSFGATMLQASAIVLVSADKSLNSAASALKLAVEDPNTHP